MFKLAVSCLVVAALTACGNSSPSNPDAANAIDARPPTDAAPPRSRALIAAGDFTAGDPGKLSELDLPVPPTVQSSVGPAMAVGDDPLVREFGGLVYIVNRSDTQNVTILDGETLALVEQLGTGTGTNPQDVAISGDNLYLPDANGVGVVVLTRGSNTTSTIDLSADDPDGLPNCESVYIIGTRLYVACGLLDDTMMYLPPRGNGMVYVYDLVADAIVASITLSTENPISTFEKVPAGGAMAGDLALPTYSFADGSGCVEHISTGATPAEAGCFVTNAQIGGEAERVDFQIDSSGNTLMWIVDSPDYMHGSLMKYDVGADMLAASATSASAYLVSDVSVCPTGEVVIADRTAALPGLRVYQDGTELSSAGSPYAIGLSPAASHGLVCYRH